MEIAEPLEQEQPNMPAPEGTMPSSAPDYPPPPSPADTAAAVAGQTPADTPDEPVTEPPIVSAPVEPPVFPTKRILLEFGEHGQRQTADVDRHTTVLDLLKHCHVPLDGSEVIKDRHGAAYGMDESIYREVSNGQVVKIHRVGRGHEHPVSRTPVTSGS